MGLNFKIILSFSVTVDFKICYLMFFNLFQWVGYCYIFLALILHYVKDGDGKYKREKISDVSV